MTVRFFGDGALARVDACFAEAPVCPAESVRSRMPAAKLSSLAQDSLRQEPAVPQRVIRFGGRHLLYREDVGNLRWAFFRKVRSGRVKTKRKYSVFMRVCGEAVLGQALSQSCPLNDELHIILGRSC